MSNEITLKSDKIKSSNDRGDCVCSCALNLSAKPKEEPCCKELKNWEVWMQRRKRVHARLKKLGRQSGNMLMNVGDEFRNVREEKLLLDATKIETQFDKYRGNPTFWTMPVCLKDKNPPYGCTELFAVKSKEERNEVGEIEKVGVPKMILQEKGILPRTRNLMDLWTNKNKYREKVVAQVRSKIFKIEPHKPEYEFLAIQGTRILPPDTDESKPETPKSPRIEIIKPVEPIREPKNETLKESTEESFTVCLKINNFECYKKMVIPSHGHKISLIFEHFISNPVPTERTIKFENVGQITMRIYFKILPKPRIFREYISSQNIFEPFKFPKTEILLLPNETLEFPIWFHSRKPGNYYEYWEIYTLPRLWSDDEKVFIKLSGYASIEGYNEKVEKIATELNKRVRDTVIKDCLNQTISRVNYCTETVSKTFDFSEKELFESQNLEDSRQIGSRSKYCYKKNIVDKLTEFYAEVRQPEDPEKWNLSIKTLKEAARKMDLMKYFKENLAASLKAKENRKLNEADTVKTEKSKPEKVQSPRTKLLKDSKSVESLDTLENKASYYNRLQTLVDSLERQSTTPHKDRRKYFYTYVVLRTCILKTLIAFDEIEKHDKKVETELVEKKEIQIPVNDNVQDRMKFENFDDSYILRTKRVCHDPTMLCNAKPKSVLLREVDLTDVKKMYAIYFNREVVKEKTNKKMEAHKAEEKSSTKKTTSKNENKKKDIVDKTDALYANIEEGFDPYAEETSVNIYTPLTVPFEITTYQAVDEIQHYEEKYLAFYRNLCEAIDSLVMAVEYAQDNIISSSLLANIKECDKTVKEEKLLSQETLDSSAQDISSELNSTSVSNYFDWLLETHWTNNPNTKKYFLEDQKLSKTYLKTSDSLCSTLRVPSLKEVSSLKNLFSVEQYERKPEPFCLKEKEVQVNLDNVQVNLDNLLDNAILSETLMTTSATPVGEKDVYHSLEKSASKNIFYFLEDACEENSSKSRTEFVEG
ncbi:uncharacterized protein LOC115876033 [Sitophilus oryzae]|uniref:Uncharacterized protein LOC115876033 n=1 Tax=Sitophilus oryzae TaxID=7048 RepID=A0A6J2X9P6_SITOR|nr:uncharacterized protein LOC115876033 [Sitophilus oryzae]